MLIHLRKWRLFKLPEQPMGCELYLRFNLSCTQSAKFLHLQKMFWSKSTYSGQPQLLCVFYFTVWEPYEHHTNNCLHSIWCLHQYVTLCLPVMPIPQCLTIWNCPQTTPIFPEDSSRDLRPLSPPTAFHSDAICSDVAVDRTLLLLEVLDLRPIDWRNAGQFILAGVRFINSTPIFSSPHWQVHRCE